jgi:hypothetical protein
MGRKIAGLTDFSGGYATDLPPEGMANNMLQTARNVYWSDGLRKREGYSQLGETGFTGNIMGHCRVYANSDWYTILAVDTGSVVDFYYSDDDNATFSAISWSSSFTDAIDVEMAVFEDKVIAVNGTDKPIIIYYSGGWTIETLEAYDTRDRDNGDWFAGQYDVSETPAYLEDTADAQDQADDNDFAISTTTDGDGCYISSVLTFTKVTFHGANQAAGGTPVVVYEYYDGSTWQNLSLVTTPDFTAAAGDRVLEFNYPLDWARMDQDLDDASGDTTYDRFMIRIRFTTAPTGTAATCDYLSVQHTQYLTQITGGDVAEHVAVHNYRVCLSSGSAINMSSVNNVADFQSYDVELFPEGGPSVTAMISMEGLLWVFKGEAVYAMKGYSWSDREVKKIHNLGCTYGNTAKAIRDYVVFMDDEFVYMMQGSTVVRVSDHISSDITSETLSEANAFVYDGRYYVSFPSGTAGGDTGVMYLFDPDTYRADDEGNGVVSWYKFSGIVAEKVLHYKGENDTQYLIGSDGDSLVRLFTGNYYDTSSETPISIDVMTKYLSFGLFLVTKNYGRIKYDISQSGLWVFTFYAEHGDEEGGEAINTPAAGGHNVGYITMPYNLDGTEVSIRLENESSVDAVIYGLAIDVARRVF